MITPTRCFDCFRPITACYCSSLPSIDNATEILILQHRRERFHRFNTARIVHRALRNSQLLIDNIPELARRLSLSPRAGLLYPGPTATLIHHVPPNERPDQLVVVDGTWHHTKTLVRDIPALQALPRYCLAPTEPSRYRIRREPDAMSLSTVEAVVSALQALEPDNREVERLLTTFDAMVERQLAHPASTTGARYKARRNKTIKNVPFALKGDLANIVVAYGEATPGRRDQERNHEPNREQNGQRSQKRADNPPVTWVAQRLGDGATFTCTLTPTAPLSATFLAHIELTQSDFASAITLQESRQQWQQFQRPGDFVIVMHPGTARLFTHIAGEGAGCFQLKSIDLNSILEQTPLAEFPPANTTTPRKALGRSTKRLAKSIALVQHLNTLLNTSAPPCTTTIS